MTRLVWLSALALASAACGGSTDSAGGGSGGTPATGGSASGGTSGSGGSATGGTSATGGSGGTATGGSGGSATGGSGGSATGGAAGSVGDAGSCVALLDTYSKALAEAVVCNPILSVIQCSGKASVPDTCGCPVVLNETQPAKVQAAQDAYGAWVSAGCGPYPCGKACFAGASGICDPTTGTCQWTTK